MILRTRKQALRLKYKTSGGDLPDSHQILQILNLVTSKTPYQPHSTLTISTLLQTSISRPTCQGRVARNETSLVVVKPLAAATLVGTALVCVTTLAIILRSEPALEPVAPLAVTARSGKALGAGALLAAVKITPERQAGAALPTPAAPQTTRPQPHTTKSR